MPAIAPRAPDPLKTLALGGLMAMAQVAVAQQADVPTLPDVTVGSTLAPSTLDQTPASITVVDGERARFKPVFERAVQHKGWLAAGQVGDFAAAPRHRHHHAQTNRFAKRLFR